MIKDLEAAIGYRFKDITLLQNALSHPSYANERWHNSLKSNERLEFLGDSVLGMVVAEYLYQTFPGRPEGELTRMRADMVCETSLAAVADKIGLGEHLLLGHGEERFGGRTRPSILADAVESVIAATFLDGGMDAAKNFIKTFILCDVPVTKLHNADYKTALQELVQQKKNAFPNTDYVVQLILNECAQQLSLWKTNFEPDYEKRYHKGSIWDIVKYRVANGRDRVKSLCLKFTEKKPNEENEVDKALQTILTKFSADEGELKLVSDENAKKLLEETQTTVRRTVDLLIENEYSMKIGFEKSGEVEYGKKALAIYGLDEKVYEEFKIKNPQIGAGGVAHYDLIDWLDTIVPENESHEYVQTEKTKKKNGRRKK